MTPEYRRRLAALDQALRDLEAASAAYKTAVSTWDDAWREVHRYLTQARIEGSTS